MGGLCFNIDLPTRIQSHSFILEDDYEERGEACSPSAFSWLNEEGFIEQETLHLNWPKTFDKTRSLTTFPKGQQCKKLHNLCGMEDAKVWDCYWKSSILGKLLLSKPDVWMKQIVCHLSRPLLATGQVCVYRWSLKYEGVQDLNMLVGPISIFSIEFPGSVVLGSETNTVHLP